MKFLFFIVLLQIFFSCQCSNLCAQANYFEYHKQINFAEEHVGNEQFSKALDIYNAVFGAYDYVFVKDYVIAAQIALLVNSEQKVSEYLERAIIEGYQCVCVERNPIFKDYITTNSWSAIKSREKEYRKNYYSRIRTDLLIEFSKRFKYEQDTKTEYEDRKKYKANVISNYNRIKSLMDSLVFPSERIIGLDQSNIPRSDNGLSDCSLGNSKVIVTLLHYDNPITDIGIDSFKKAIELGFLHPKEFAAIFNFEKNNYSRITKDININKANLPNNFNWKAIGMNVKRQKFLDASYKYRFRVNFDYK